ncbi:GPI mannosyltransferase 4 isoform X3 [Hydra vulgaris]|uniref:Mannosyltransferase n=1 Tax=Hydra vulgaris TaxID=6087 RepID=A0ABM4DD69_HYDVU
MGLTLNNINLLLFILRVVLVILPFPGYIHPDQYFQSTEVMAGDILRLKSDLTWEWNSLYPVRNIVFPALSSGIMFWLAKFVKNNLLNFDYTPYLLLILPRIMMLLITVLIEKLFLIIICQEKLKIKKMCIFLFRSSHVSLIFLTTTFSNTFETLLFVLIFYQSRCLTKAIRKSSDRVYIQAFYIGLTTAFGFFIRPSFLAFAFYPLLHVAIMTLILKSFFQIIIIAIKFFFLFSTGFLLGTCFNIFIDTAYFSRINMNSWVLTPLNFIKYNTNVTLLQKHGLHPRMLHFGVNMVLLYGPLYLYLILLLIKKINSKETRLSTSKEFLCFVLCSTLVPVFIMSIVQHQEPRFILSVLIPLIISVVVLSMKRLNVFFFSTWIMFNILGTFWYGFAHQGGIVPALSQIHIDQKSTSLHYNHFIFWKTYMIPKHLLALSKHDKNTHIYDLAGADIDVFLNKLRSFQELSKVNKVWLICPSSMHDIIKNNSLYTFDLKHQFFPHVSVENLPTLNVQFFESLFNFQITTFFRNLYSLNMYRVYINNSK